MVGSISGGFPIALRRAGLPDSTPTNSSRQALPPVCDGGGDGIQLVEFVRAFGKPKARMEAITSRPLLLSGVGRKTAHAGQQHLTIAPMHGKASQSISLLTKVSLLLKEWKSIAEQSNLKTVWFQVCEHIAKLVTGLNWLAPLESRMRIEIKPG